MRYQIPSITETKPLKNNDIILVTSDGLRISANQKCWPAQKVMFHELGIEVNIYGNVKVG